MASLAIKNKKGGVIHRTTSETLRLGDSSDLLNNHNPVRVSVQSSGSRKKSQTSPSCSFQITGVSLTRCDLGDDSADDLDESHTDDISRVTDNETPSFSEDSKDTDDHLLQPIHNPLTVVPQQQQSTEIKWQDPESRDLGLGRFKVVKIESVAPFSRGRWTCFDYLDHSENAPKVPYVYCKQQFVRQEKSSNGGNVRSSCASSLIADNTSFIEAGDGMYKRISSTSNVNFWDPHCQEYMYHSGTMILPHPVFVPLPLGRQTKCKARSSCPVSPNVISPLVIAPVKITHDVAPIKEDPPEDRNNKENVINRDSPKATSDVQIIQKNEQADVKSKEVVAQNGTQNVGRFVENFAEQSVLKSTLASPERISQLVRRNENVTGTMATSHRRSVDSPSNKSHATVAAGDAPTTNELPLVVSDLDFNEATFFAVYCFIRNFVGASVSCTATIDTKIEHALDVVKNHLTHAVRLEVEELKVKINELVDRISYLEYENDLLRANVAPDVLATLGNNGSDK